MGRMRKGEKGTREFARGLRKNMTEAESKLWSHIRGKLLSGYRFRRQHPIPPYIADFVCISENLIIEVDGATHGDADEIAYDERRTAFLKSQGWRIARYGNEEIYKNADDVLDDIDAHLKGLK